MTARVSTESPPVTAGPALPAGAVPIGQLGAVLRGLAAVFWGLPVCLFAFARHFLAFWPGSYDLLFPTVGCGLLLFGLVCLGRFQARERIWQRALLESQVLGLILVGLSPFLFLWSRVPAEDLYARAVAFLLLAAMAFLISLTRTLVRLAAMLPDPVAQADAQLFHGLTTYVVVVIVGVCGVLYWRLSPVPLTEFLALPRQPIGFTRQALLLLLLLVPIAVSMAVTWKLKEIVFGLLVSVRPGPAT